MREEGEMRTVMFGREELMMRVEGEKGTQGMHCQQRGGEKREGGEREKARERIDSPHTSCHIGPEKAQQKENIDPIKDLKAKTFSEQDTREL